jgi:hypothetical protein
MSTFAVQIKRIKEIETHPNADADEDVPARVCAYAVRWMLA